MTAANHELNGGEDPPAEVLFGEGANPWVAMRAMLSAKRADVSTAKTNTQKNEARNRVLVDEWKLGNQCCWCQFRTDDPKLLHLDHRDPDEKDAQGRAKRDESRALNLRWSMTRVLQELAKCDVVCAECHAAITTIRDGAPLPKWAKRSEKLAAAFAQMYVDNRREGRYQAQTTTLGDGGTKAKNGGARVPKSQVLANLPDT